MTEKKWTKKGNRQEVIRVVSQMILDNGKHPEDHHWIAALDYLKIFAKEHPDHRASIWLTKGNSDEEIMNFQRDWNKFCRDTSAAKGQIS